LHRIFQPGGQYIEAFYPPSHSIAIFTPASVIQIEYVLAPPQLGETNSAPPPLDRHRSAIPLQWLASDT
jgi:hypothetical protein